MLRGVMVRCVLLVFVGMSMGDLVPNTTQGDSGYEHNEETLNWNGTLYAHNIIKNDEVLNILDLKDETSSNHTTDPITEEVSIPEPNPLSSGYIPGRDFGGNDVIGFYKFYKQENQRNWYEAFKTCAKEGAHLFLINTLPESRAIVMPMAKAGTFGEWHWVGIHDGGEAAMLSNETTGSGNIYKCQAVRYDIFTINYDRLDCEQKKSFICEMNTST
ncbi:hypothetical protein C0J52_19882 [Blattella germanica]|nr:hypothetical protein C0J52_19882 [Blattella germanica]